MTSCDRGTAPLDGAGSRMIRARSGVVDFSGLDGQIAARPRLAQQHETLGNLGIGEPQRRTMRVVNLALQEAGAA